MNTLKAKNKGWLMSNNRFTFKEYDSGYIIEEPRKSAYIEVKSEGVVKGIEYLNNLLDTIKYGGTTERGRNNSCTHNHLGKDHINYAIGVLTKKLITVNPTENLPEFKKIIKSIVNCNELISIYNNITKGKDVL